MSTEITTRNMPSDLINAAITGGADLEKLEKLLELQERWEANEAKKAYISAMAAFKSDPPKIMKTKQVSFNQTSYKHALLADAAEKINKALSANGLSAAWTTRQSEKDITVTCTITHSQGHSESTSLTASADVSGGKNAIQAIGSTVSYLERYTLFALTGLASHDMDDDGKGSEAKYITEEHQNTILAMIDENNMGENYLASFLKWLGCESLDALPAKDYNKAVNGLKVAIKKKA